MMFWDGLREEIHSGLWSKGTAIPSLAFHSLLTLPAERHSEQAGVAVSRLFCVSVWMCVCVCARRRTLTGCRGSLIAFSRYVQCFSTWQPTKLPLSHSLFLCTKILCLSSLVTFTKLSKCTLWLKWWQYFPCAPTLPSGGSCRAAERGAVRMKVKVWGTLQNSCLELWITKGLFFWSVTCSSATVLALYKKIWEEAGRTSLWEILTITHCWG